MKEKTPKKIEELTIRRKTTADEVLFIFEKILENWKTIRIYNTIKQNNPNSKIIKEKVETISTGNCKIFENELSPEKYNYYLELRNKVYLYHKNKKIHFSN
jgi:hypothetical protein